MDERIRTAETTVAAAKAKYDSALDELEKLVTKKKQLDDKKDSRLFFEQIFDGTAEYFGDAV